MCKRIKKLIRKIFGYKEYKDIWIIGENNLNDK